MNDPWLNVVQVTKSFKDLFCVSFDVALMKRPILAVLCLQRVRHELHKDGRLALRFIDNTPVILDDVLVFERAQELKLCLQLLLETIVLDTDHLDGHLRWEAVLVAVSEGARILRLSPVVEALVHFPE